MRGRTGALRFVPILCALAAAAQDPAPREESDEHPAPTLQPPVPPIGGAGGAPLSRPLPRDGSLSDRFFAEGQSVRYTFEAEGGELSIFDLGNWGMARGWESTVGLRVLNAQGEVLDEVLRPGGTVFRKLRCFTAPAKGTYELELTAVRHHYRYTLVRHSGYRARPPGTEYRFGDRNQLHGYLADPRDRVGYLLELAAGERVAIRVVDTHPQGAKQARAMRARAPGRVVQVEPVGPLKLRSAGSEEEMRRRLRGEAGETAPFSYPSWTLEVANAKGEVLACAAHFVLLSAPDSGTYRVTVGANGSGEGGIFDLVVERDPELVHVTGYVGDRDDDPVAGITIHLLHEPGIDHVATVVTDAGGDWEADLPPGPYTLLLRQGEDGPLERVQTGIEAARQVNAIYPH